MRQLPDDLAEVIVHNNVKVLAQHGRVRSLDSRELVETDSRADGFVLAVFLLISSFCRNLSSVPYHSHRDAKFGTAIVAMPYR